MGAASGISSRGYHPRISAMRHAAALGEQIRDEQARKVAGPYVPGDAHIEWLREKIKAETERAAVLDEQGKTEAAAQTRTVIARFQARLDELTNAGGGRVTSMPTE
jgi:hypothetical protein